jgi:hypothetical protein
VSLQESVGKTFGPYVYAYGPREVMLYALGVGATPREMDYLYEARGPRVFPTFFAAAGFADSCDVVLDGMGLADKALVHSDQELIVIGEMPPAGTMVNLLTVTRVHDAGTGAVIDVECLTEVDGRPVCRSRVGLFSVGAGGFGGNGAHEGERYPIPSRGADRTIDMPTREDQSLLYRLSFLHTIAPGTPRAKACDPHVDPADAQAAGFDGPVLHGICTFGFLCRAALAEIDRIGGKRLSRMIGRFTAPVHPGQTLTTEMWHCDDRLVARMRSDDGANVISNAAVEYEI